MEPQPARAKEPAWRRLLREPLLHFFLVGAVLFALAGNDDDGAGPRTDEIVIRAAQVEQLTAAWIKARRHVPTPDELAGLLEDHIKEEVYYREALAMRLDRDDMIVRRRLRQKLEFLFEDASSFADPSEQELASYRAEHPDGFREEDRFTFEHVFVRVEAATNVDYDATARALLEKLLAGGDSNQLGDRTALPPSLEDATEADVAAQFGPEFALALGALEAGPWGGPVRSTYGLHLVRVSERTRGSLPPLARIRGVVEREWRAKRRAVASEAFYQSLRQRYRIRVEAPGVSSPADEQ